MSPPTLTSVHLNHLIQETGTITLHFVSHKNISHLYWGVSPLHQRRKNIRLEAQQAW